MLLRARASRPLYATAALLTSIPSPAADREPAPPLAAEEKVVVTASRTGAPAEDEGSAVTLLTSDELAAAPSASLDEALRGIGGFTLFRRTGSRAANPTTSGASFRGFGGSGAGRALVLADGIPQNDPFGGWVAWGRVPRLALERVEVLRGGASDRYGSAALAGVVQLVRREPRRDLLLAEAWGASGAGAASVYAGGARGAWQASIAAEALRDDGYVTVDDRARGPIDTPAGSRHRALEAAATRTGESGVLFARASLYDESRTNGTPFQRNETAIAELALGAAWGRGPRWSARAWHRDQTYEQTFSAVAPDRASETPTREQRVPADATGAIVEVTSRLGRAGALAAGVEATLVDATSLDRAAGAPATELASGGRRVAAAAFVEAHAPLATSVTATAGLRYDRWEERDVVIDGASAPAPDARDALSPRLALVLGREGRCRGALQVRAAFRAPTPNELYRGFRVGDVVTRPNPGLAPEELWDGEAGLRCASRGGGGALRVTAFWGEIDGPIANVTVDGSAGPVVRERRNLGRSRSRGVELEGETTLGRGVTLHAAALLVDARVTAAPGAPGVEGNRVPQVPRAQLALAARGRFGRTHVTLAGRVVGEQYDDDLNQYPLAGYAALDLHVERALTPAVALFASAENVFDERFEAGRTPVLTLGPPRFVRVGLRLRLAR